MSMINGAGAAGKPSPFEVRGVVEGFYGPYYTAPKRDGLIEFIGRHGFNLYIYGPKMDRRHRERWWEPYPKEVMKEFARSVEVAEKSGVRFCYALSCGEKVQLSSNEDLERAFGKLKSLYEVGVRDFAIFFDDIPGELEHASDREVYSGYGEAHADFSNRLRAKLQALDASCTLSVCPTYYAGSAPFDPYVHELGEGLAQDVDVFYTGSDVCVNQLHTADGASFGEAVKRAPLIWDNYPVNDGPMRTQLHIGPIRGREETLYESVRGIVVNPMIQPEASKIPLATFGDYLSDPHHYSPEVSWKRALEEVAGTSYAGALQLVAETSLRSCVDRNGAPRLSALSSALLGAAQKGQALTELPETAALDAYLTELEDACDLLANRLGNEDLRVEILPWVETLAEWARATKVALDVVEAVEGGQDFARPLKALENAAADARRRSEQIGRPQLEPLVDWVLESAAAAKASGQAQWHEIAETPR